MKDLKEAQVLSTTILPNFRYKGILKSVRFQFEIEKRVRTTWEGFGLVLDPFILGSRTGCRPVITITSDRQSELTDTDTCVGST